jgi:nickel/cobalt exporter
MKRFAVAVGLMIVAFGVLGFARPASAHPLGNFSVNQLASLDLRTDRIDVAVTIDLAELPTLQEQPTVDRDGPTAFASASCTGFARDFAVSVNGARVTWTVSASAFTTTPGSAGLATSRITCRLTAPADLANPSTVDIENRYRTDRVGWRELTATARGVHLVGSPLPEQSVTGGLTTYPEDLLSSPLDVRTARLRVEPGDGPSSTAAGAPIQTGSSWLTGGTWLASAEQTLRDWVAQRRVTPVVGVLAVLLALALGAAHAALPGHGKTVMAAYLAGRHGRPRDALAVGATVTLTHTGGVLVLGLLLTTVAGLAGERILSWLGVASGTLIALLGAAMLIGLRRRLGRPHSHGGHAHAHGLFGRPHSHGPHGHTHAHGLFSRPGPHGDDTHSHDDDGHTHSDSHPAHSHGDHAHPHSADDGHHHGEHDSHAAHAHSRNGHHDHSHGDGTDASPADQGGTRGKTTARSSLIDAKRRAPSRLSIVSMGIAGGLVPSPSALIILLGAIGLGRTGFGVLLVVGYGLGMAATLTAAGLLLIKLQDRWSGRLPRLTARLSRLAPTGTAALVLLVGLGLAGRAFATL